VANEHPELLRDRLVAQERTTVTRARADGVGGGSVASSSMPQREGR